MEMQKNSAESELSAGPIQIVDSIPTRRANIKYIPRLPVIQDPNSGADIPATSWTLGSPTAYFHDADNDGIFDIDAEFAFIDGNNNGSFTDANDAKFDNGILLIALPSVPFVPAGPFLPLDYTTVTVTGSDGSIY